MAKKFVLNLMFQSPRSGKFVSDVMVVHQFLDLSLMFQSPRSGKFVSDLMPTSNSLPVYGMRFQSPRSGKFVSDFLQRIKNVKFYSSFNPLDRGNLYQM